MTAETKHCILEWCGILGRWAVGALFVYMGLSKAFDPVGFLKLVRQYDLPVHYFVLNFISVVLPWLEVVCGVLLLSGVAVRGTALLVLLMLVPFTFVVTQRALEIASANQIALCAVKFDCGCGAGDVFICVKLVENLLMTAVAVWLLFGWGRTLSLRYKLLPGSLRNSQ
jgi:uncharacterized membrane protein YphA (DoxX/SURF4 family)